MAGTELLLLDRPLGSTEAATAVVEEDTAALVPEGTEEVVAEAGTAEEGTTAAAGTTIRTRASSSACSALPWLS